MRDRVFVALIIGGLLACACGILSQVPHPPAPPPTTPPPGAVNTGVVLPIRGGVEKVLDLLANGYAKDGITLHPCRTINARVTLVGNTTIRIDLAEPRPKLDVKYFLRFTNKPVTGINITPTSVEVQIDGLPDATLPVEP